MTESRRAFGADGHELSAAGGFTTEVYVKRYMAAGEASHVPGAELAEQEGAGNTETEQAAGEEGDERAALYEKEADDMVEDFSNTMLYQDDYANLTNDPYAVTGKNVGEPEYRDLMSVAEEEYKKQVPYSDHNTCDEFVARIIQNSGRNPVQYHLENTDETVLQHINDLKLTGLYLTEPDGGANIVFMGDGNSDLTRGHEHCGLLFLESDGTIVYYDSSSNNKINNPIREEYSDFLSFKAMYHLYDSFYFQHVY